MGSTFIIIVYFTLSLGIKISQETWHQMRIQNYVKSVTLQSSTQQNFSKNSTKTKRCPQGSVYKLVNFSAVSTYVGFKTVSLKAGCGGVGRGTVE